MIREILKYGAMFIVLVLIQVLILNNIQFSGYVNPFVYVLFLLLLPFETPKHLTLFLGFILGLSIDIFSNTLGIHASATTFLAFFRPIAIDLTTSRDSIDAGILPRVKHMGFGWFFRYSLVLIAAHHIFLFFVEVFTFQDFIHTFLRSLFSTFFTIVIVLISQFLIFKE